MCPPACPGAVLRSVEYPSPEDLAAAERWGRRPILVGWWELAEALRRHAPAGVLQTGVEVDSATERPGGGVELRLKGAVAGRMARLSVALGPCCLGGQGTRSVPSIWACQAAVPQALAPPCLQGRASRCTQTCWWAATATTAGCGRTCSAARGPTLRVRAFSLAATCLFAHGQGHRREAPPPQRRFLPCLSPHCLSLPRCHCALHGLRPADPFASPLIACPLRACPRGCTDTLIWRARLPRERLPKPVERITWVMGGGAVGLVFPVSAGDVVWTVSAQADRLRAAGLEDVLQAHQARDGIKYDSAQR